MGEAQGGRNSDPDVETNQVLLGRTVSGRREYVQPQNGLSALRKSYWIDGKSCEIKHKTILS